MLTSYFYTNILIGSFDWFLEYCTNTNAYQTAQNSYIQVVVACARQGCSFTNTSKRGVSHFINEVIATITRHDQNRMHLISENITQLECGTWYHHPRRLQCVWSRNLRIFKVATWHYRCRHNLKNNCIWDNLQCCLLVPMSPSKACDVDRWPAISKSEIHWDRLLACIT